MRDTFLITSQTKKIYLIFVDSTSNVRWNSVHLVSDAVKNI